MEIIGNRATILNALQDIKDDTYYVLIVKEKSSLNQLYTVLRKACPPGLAFDEWKQQVKEKHGLYYFDGEKVYKSFKQLSTKERKELIRYYEVL